MILPTKGALTTWRFNSPSRSRWLMLQNKLQMPYYTTAQRAFVELIYYIVLYSDGNESFENNVDVLWSYFYLRRRDEALREAEVTAVSTEKGKQNDPVVSSTQSKQCG